MTTFSQAHHGDKVRICLPGGTTKPLRLLVDPARCSDTCCLALHSRGVDRMGWIEPIQAYSDTVIDVIELGPSSSAPELATFSGDDLAAADYEDAMSAYLSADEPEIHLAPVVGGPSDDIEADWEHRHREQADDLNDTDDAGDDEK